MINKILNLKTLYYVLTLIVALLVGFMGGFVDIIHTQGVIDASNHLGYPLYFFTLLGVFKILGGIALLLPKKFEKYSKIAYIGFTFDFIFASFSHFSVGDPFGKIIVPLVFLGILAGSYILKKKITAKEEEK